MNKKIIYITVLIALVFFISCGHYASIINFLNCIFYGECSEFYYTGSTRSVQLIAGDYNDGTTLEGEWQNKNADNLYRLKFLNNGTLNITLYDNNNVERYDEGIYSVQNNILTIEMKNGTSSTVKFSISNRTLTLNSEEEQLESNQNTD